jgi:hypothetical protein
MSGRKVNQIKQITGRVTLALLVSVYLLFSIGIIKATHFCMGREASVAFFSTETKKCPCSLYATEKNSCCDDEHELIKLDNEQKSISVFSMAVPKWFVLEELYTAQLIAMRFSDVNYPNEEPAAEIPPKVPLWKSNCSLVLYDEEWIA